MSNKRKISAFVIMILIIAPGIMIFNEDAEKLYINLLGAAYIYLMKTFHRRMLPDWVVEYLHPANP